MEGKYGQRTPFDFAIDFLANKTHPSARVLVDYLKQATFEGKPPTIKEEIPKLVTPISIQNVINLNDDASLAEVVGTISDIIGVGATTYKK